MNLIRREATRFDATAFLNASVQRAHSVTTDLFRYRNTPCFMIRRVWFPTLWLFIGIVSAIDCFLLYRFRHLIQEVEENPVGRYLIEIDGGNVTVFLLTKLAGTVVVMTVLAGLYVYCRRWSLAITGSIASFQLSLLVYVALSIPAAQSSKLSTLHLAGGCAPRPRTIVDDVSVFFPIFDSDSPGEPVKLQ
jgi:hypothetical protein